MALCFFAHAENSNPIDDQIAEATQKLRSAPEDASPIIEKLRKQESQFTTAQRDKFNRVVVFYYGLRGKYTEQISYAQSVLPSTQNPDIKASLYYSLAEAYKSVGQYENALKAMNEGIVLLPTLTELNAKKDILQSAVALLSTIHAYDEALVYADRLAELGNSEGGKVALCLADANKVDIYFDKQLRAQARLIVPEAIKNCDQVGATVISLIVKTISTIDLIDSGSIENGLKEALELHPQLVAATQNSDFITLLEDAMAKGYLKQAKFEQAEKYAKTAFDRARSENVVSSIEKASQTLASIKRAQGRFDEALEYTDICIEVKNKVLDEELHKNIAYQRVKFDSQDKINQLVLLEQKNKILVVARQLEQRNNQILILLIAMVLVILVIVAASLHKTLKQKNLFRLSSQIDGLTQVSNRAFFVSSAEAVFKHRTGPISVILFDMDNFKQINDTFGHSAGDWVLTTISEVVKLHLRKSDLIGRLGGEEFAVCLPDSSEEEAFALADRCRAAIAAIDTNGCGYRFPISASFGVATRGTRNLVHFDETLAAADKALYFSKTEGRNRVSIYQ